MEQRREYRGNTVLAWRMLNTCLAGAVCTVMAALYTSYRMSHRATWFIGLGLAALFSLNALGSFQKYFKMISCRLGCSIDRNQGAQSSFIHRRRSSLWCQRSWAHNGALNKWMPIPVFSREVAVPAEIYKPKEHLYAVPQGVPRGGSSLGLYLPYSHIVYTKMPSSTPGLSSSPCLRHLNAVKNKSLRSWYRSSMYAYNFPSRREDYITDLEILETFLRCEEKKERYSQLCGILASYPTFWDYSPSMEYYSHVLMDNQYQVAWMPHRHWQPLKRKRLGL